MAQTGGQVREKSSVWMGNCFSHQLPLIPRPVLGKQLFFTEFTEYLELERTHKDHCVSTLDPAQETPKQSHPVLESVVQILLTLFLMALILHKMRDPQLHIPGKPPLCSLGRTHTVFLMQGCSSSHSWLWEWTFWKVPVLWIAPGRQLPLSGKQFLAALEEGAQQQLKCSTLASDSWQRTSDTMVTLAWREALGGTWLDPAHAGDTGCSREEP